MIFSRRGLAIGSGLLIFAIVLTVLHFTSSSPQVANPLCTGPALQQLKNYWAEQVSQAPADPSDIYAPGSEASVEASAIVALSARATYCEAHS